MRKEQICSDVLTQCRFEHKTRSFNDITLELIVFVTVPHLHIFLGQFPHTVQLLVAQTENSEGFIHVFERTSHELKIAVFQELVHQKMELQTGSWGKKGKKKRKEKKVVVEVLLQVLMTCEVC